MGGHWCPTAQPPPASSALLVGLRDDDESGYVCAWRPHHGLLRPPSGARVRSRSRSRSRAHRDSITGYSGSRNRRGQGTRSIPIEHARAQVARVTRRQPVCESSRRVGRLRGHRLAGARTRTHSRHNDHLWRATGRGSAAGPPRPRHQPAFDSAEANPRDTQTLRDFLMGGPFDYTLSSNTARSWSCQLAIPRYPRPLHHHSAS